MKHTPGPWKFGGMASAEVFAADGSEICVVHFSDRWMEGLTDTCHDHKEQKANAQLIAAAPDLYETGGLLIRTINDTLRHWNQPSQREALQECARMFCTVLNKAKGIVERKGAK